MNGYVIYTLCWALCVFAAIVILAGKPQAKNNLAGYGRFLMEPWKVVTFLIAASGVTLAAPYSGDPTWDYVDGVFMSVLVFVTAPWAVGAVFRSVRSRARWEDIYIALCLMLFSSSWSYDAYVWMRDGVYPPTWFSNLIISPAIYTAGGLFWNLEYLPGRGMSFSFQRDSWYLEPVRTSFTKLLWIAIPLMAFAFYAVAWFVIPH